MLITHNTQILVLDLTSAGVRLEHARSLNLMNGKKMTDAERAEILLLGGCKVCRYYWKNENLCLTTGLGLFLESMRKVTRKLDKRGYCEKWQHEDD